MQVITAWAVVNIRISPSQDMSLTVTATVTLFRMEVSAMTMTHLASYSYIEAPGIAVRKRNGVVSDEATYQTDS